MKTETGQFNVLPDSHLPMDCDGKFREQDCAYCIEYNECKEIGEKKNDRNCDFDDKNCGNND